MAIEAAAPSTALIQNDAVVMGLLTADGRHQALLDAAAIRAALPPAAAARLAQLDVAWLTDTAQRDRAHRPRARHRVADIDRYP